MAENGFSASAAAVAPHSRSRLEVLITSVRTGVPSSGSCPRVLASQLDTSTESKQRPNGAKSWAWGEGGTKSGQLSVLAQRRDEVVRGHGWRSGASAADFLGPRSCATDVVKMCVYPSSPTPAGIMQTAMWRNKATPATQAASSAMHAHSSAL